MMAEFLTTSITAGAYHRINAWGRRKNAITPLFPKKKQREKGNVEQRDTEEIQRQA